MTEIAMLGQLGAWLAGTRFEELNHRTLTTAKRAILDCIGVTLAAVDTPLAGVVGKVVSTADGPGTATVLGTALRCAPDGAAFANGALGHALDFDDVSHTLGGHPTVSVLPAALAIAEARRLSGLELLLGYAVGVEIETAIAHGVNFAHYDKGWHPTATLGTFGSAAATARLLGLDADRATAALSLATSFAAGIKAGFGTMAKPLQVGRAGQSGLMCGLLAEAGATAKPDAFEATQGFANVFNGPGTFDLAAIPAALANPWDLDEPGVALKLHPCCGGTHSAVDAALEVRAGLSDIEDIRGIEVAVHPRRFAHLDRPTVGDDPLEAKFSLQYSVALALVFGRIEISQYDRETLARQDVRRMLAKVHARPLAEAEWGPEHFAATIAVELGDGSRRTSRWERPRGRTPETALSYADIESKFAGCVKGVLDEAQTKQVAELVDGLETVADITELTSLLRGKALAR
ncbi:MAG TPA: MmgE/PrpD family protein [Pseudonocardiaceae bacterium]